MNQYFNNLEMWIGKVRVPSYELRVAPVLRVASCELRVSSEKCELVHLKRELRVPKKTSNFHLLQLKNCDFLDSLYKIRDLQKSFFMFIISNFRI